MKPGVKKSLTIVTLIAGLGMAAWSPATYACAAEPMLASVCVMAISPGVRFQSFNGTYMLAAGQVLPLNQYTALFSLLGTTFGGNGSSTVGLPDLRGRVIVGYDPTNASYAVGAKAGTATIKLTVAQLPPHAVQFSGSPATINGLTGTTSLTGLSATANLSGMTLTGAASGLQLNGSSTGGLGTAGGNLLGKPTASAGNIYSAAATPDVQLNAKSIGGTLSLKVDPNITAPVTISATGATTTIVGTSASISATSAIVGGGADIPVMPPYLVLPYYIAHSGIYPSGD